MSIKIKIFREIENHLLCLLRDVAAKAQVYWTKIKLALKSTLTGELEYVPTKTQVNFLVARS